MSLDLFILRNSFHERIQLHRRDRCLKPLDDLPGRWSGAHQDKSGEKEWCLLAALQLDCRLEYHKGRIQLPCAPLYEVCSGLTIGLNNEHV